MCCALHTMCASGVLAGAGAAAAVLLLSGALAAATGNVSVTVERRQVTFEDIHILTVNSTVEYILQFVPVGDQGKWPSRLWVRVSGGDTARPLLVTARRKTGALTWQLPYYSGGALLYEMERAQCPEDSVVTEALDADCEAESAAGSGELSLHLSTACAAGAGVVVWLRAAPDRGWALPFDAPVSASAALGAPRVHYYEFSPGQESVRLVVASEDDVCATVAVQNYTCPIAETLDDIETSALRMTVQRSGGAQLSRSQYPRGFYVIAVVHDSERACLGAAAPADDWLWEAAVLAAADGERAERAAASASAAQRNKTLTFTITASLTRAQYAVGVGVTLALFLAFYVAFGLLVLAQRWPRWARLVGPRAVLANKAEESGTPDELAMSASPRRRRRDSTATFDSSDNSDTDDEEEGTETVTTVATAAPSPATTPPATTPPATTPPATTPPATTPPATTPPATTPPATTPPATTPPATTPPATTPTATTPPATTPPAITPPATTSADTTPVATAAAENGIYIVDANTEGAGAGAGAGAARPFGLPARLHVAALARRRERVLHARSDRYLYTLYTVALFYALPVVQFVAAFQLVLNVSGSLDMCYYNFLCAHPAGALSDFNHVFSNAGYLLLGALFLLQVRRRRLRRRRAPRHEEYGIPAHYGLLSSLGASMMMVALLSAAYHTCPNGLNFQFDTAFMYVMAVLSMVKIYQSRHPDINARAHATFGVLAILIALVVWGVLAGGPLFWSLFTVLHVFTVLMLSLSIYYVGQFRFEKQSLQEAARGLRSRPLYTPRLVMLLIANTVNWAFALYGLFEQSADFASHLLGVLLVNTLLYMVFYIAMKLLHGERLRWYAWAFLAGGACAWAAAVQQFAAGSTDWAAAPARSRHRNHECRVLRFYDSHDLWHMLSAVALYFSFNAMLTWDDGLAAVKRTEIAVF